MSKWLLTLSGSLLIFCGGCCCNDLEECQEGLSECEENFTEYQQTCGPIEECQPSSDTAFNLVLKADSYGTFLPVNNQFPGNVGTNAPFHSGFFVQLGWFPYSNHNYSNIQLVFPDQSSTLIDDKEVQWVDIVCDQSSDIPLENVEAQILLPIQDLDANGDVVPPVSKADRRLHQDMDVEKEMMALITIWQGPDGLTVEAKRDDEIMGHEHDQYTFKSKSACAVRVWERLGDAAPTYDYSAGEVVAIRVIETEMDVPHGGVHHPPWT